MKNFTEQAQRQVLQALKYARVPYGKIIISMGIAFFCGALTSCGQSGHLYLPVDQPIQSSSQST